MATGTWPPIVLIENSGFFTESLDIRRFETAALTRAKLDFVIFQRTYGPNAVDICRKLRRNGTTCGFFMADLYPNDMLIEVDFVLTPSTCLRETLINSGIDARRVFCLPDAVETVPCLRKKYFPRSSDMHATTKIVWVGNEGHWPTLDTIRALLDSHPSFKTYKLVTISNHPDADIAWQLDRVWDDIISCDIGVVPVDVTNPRSLVKSNNRATMYMALALPVVCTPISSYAEFIRHGVNGFLATSDSDWVVRIERPSAATKDWRNGIRLCARGVQPGHDCIEVSIHLERTSAPTNLKREKPTTMRRPYAGSEKYYEVMLSEGIHNSEETLEFALDTLFGNFDFTDTRVLDIGGGRGLFSFYAASCGAEEVICVDPESAGSSLGVHAKFIRIRRLLGLSNVKLEPLAFQEYESDGKPFDLIILHNSINHLDETACIHLMTDEGARAFYQSIFLSRVPASVAVNRENEHANPQRLPNGTSYAMQLHGPAERSRTTG